MAEAPSTAVSRPFVTPLVRALRTGAIGFGTGMLVGGVVGGLGGRIVMRILFLENRETIGGITENGNEIGVITSGGTASLILFAAFAGAVAGVMYVLVRRWLPGGSVARGLLFGAFLLVAFGGGSIDAENVDFRIFRPAGLAIALFGLLPFAFGVSLALFVDRWDSYVPAFFKRKVPTVVGYAALSALAVREALDFAGTVAGLV